MLEPYDGKLSRTVLRREGGGNTADPADYTEDKGDFEIPPEDDSDEDTSEEQDVTPI